MCPTGERLTVHNLSHHTGSTLVGSMFSATTSQLSQDPYHIRVFFQDSTDIQIYICIYIYHMHLIYLHTHHIYIYVYIYAPDLLTYTHVAQHSPWDWCPSSKHVDQTWGLLFGYYDSNDGSSPRDCMVHHCMNMATVLGNIVWSR